MIKQTNDKNIILNRLLLSLGILIFIRIGTFLPVPVINHSHLAFYLERHSMTKSLVSTFAGNDTFVIGLFTLNIFPYINASILMQVLISLFPSLSKLQKEGGGEGRRSINKLTRIITLGWALIQSFSIAFYLKRALFDWNLYLAAEIIIWLTTGAMIVLWLSEIITEYGLGNGASLLIYTNIISNLPNFAKNLFINASQNVSVLSWLAIGVLFFVAISGIVLLQESTRIVPLISSKQLNRVFKGIITNLENNGYPFASVKLDSIRIKDSNISASLSLEKNKQIRTFVDHTNEENKDSWWGYLSEGEIIEMNDSGLVDFQCHGYTHTWYESSDKILNFFDGKVFTPHLKWNLNTNVKPFWLKKYNEMYLPLGYPIFEFKTPTKLKCGKSWPLDSICVPMRISISRFFIFKNKSLSASLVFVESESCA